MVMSPKYRSRAAMNIELVVAMGVLVTAMIPIAGGFLSEIKMARRCYYDVAAMEILDGETEIIAAGNWKAYTEGEHPLRVSGPVISNLPPGKFMVVRRQNSIRVEWRPEKRGRAMAREVKLQ